MTSQPPIRPFPCSSPRILTPLVAAFVLTGIASAAMSTTDSLLLMSGSAIAHDIVRRTLHEPNGIKKDERYYLRISRLTILAIGAISFVFAIPEIALLLRLVSFAVAIVGACFFFPLLFGFELSLGHAGRSTRLICRRGQRDKFLDRRDRAQL